MGLQLPDEYGYVVLAHCMSWISNFYLTFNVKARKQYNVQYPALYAADNHSNAEKFNSVQRAHQNTLERWGYAKNGPNGRMVGALLSHLGDFPLLIGGFVKTAYNLIKKQP